MNFYGDREILNRICFTNSELFKDFGFDLYSELRRVKYDEDDNKVKWIFEEILYSKLKANTITKLTTRYGYPANKLPKTILRSVTQSQKNKKIEDKGLLYLYDAYEAEILEEHKCKNRNDARVKGVADEVSQRIAKRLAEEKKYNVIKLNVIEAYDIDFGIFELHYGRNDVTVIDNEETQKKYRDIHLSADKLRTKFNNVITASFEKAVLKRVFNPEKYKNKLTWEQRKLLLKYLKQFMKKDYKEEFKELENLKPQPINLDWVDLL